jgi:hypothetical protein
VSGALGGAVEDRENQRPGLWPWIHISEVVRDLVDDMVKAMTERPIEAETANDVGAKEQDDG